MAWRSTREDVQVRVSTSKMVRVLSANQSKPKSKQLGDPRRLTGLSLHNTLEIDRPHLGTSAPFILCGLDRRLLDKCFAKQKAELDLATLKRLSHGILNNVRQRLRDGQSTLDVLQRLQAEVLGGWSPLHEAASKNLAKECRSLLKGVPSRAYARDKLGGSALHTAAFNGAVKAATHR